MCFGTELAVELEFAHEFEPELERFPLLCCVLVELAVELEPEPEPKPEPEPGLELEPGLE